MNIWSKIASLILSYRWIWLSVIVGITVFMAFQAQKAELSYSYNNLVPESDEEQVYFKRFKKIFGEDANIVALAVQDKDLLKVSKFNELLEFSNQIAGLKGVTQVLSLPRIQTLKKDTTLKKFYAQSIFPKTISNQIELDSLMKEAKKLKFYDGQLINFETGATVVVISIDKKILDAPARQQLMDQIFKLGKSFTDKTQIKIHYAGIPMVRSIFSTKLKAELQLLLILSGLATAAILFIFFRSFTAVIVPLIVIAILIVWTLGLVSILGYKITLVTSLLPPILVVIGIPNCVYLITKYHQEYLETNDKRLALQYVIEKIGIAAFLTNATTAVGFSVFILMQIKMLREFGVLSSLSVINTFFVCLILLPILFSFLPAPKKRHLKHLEHKPVQVLLSFLDFIVFKRKVSIYTIVVLLIIFSAYGFTLLRPLAYMVDDLPEKGELKQDLRFFEKNFKGIMPLEIVVNTGQKKGIFKLSTLQKIDNFEQSLKEIPVLSPPISIVGFLKASRQAYYENDTAFYSLPTSQDRSFLLNYFKNSQDNSGLLNSFVDTTGQEVRISLKIADIGSIKLNELVENELKPRIKTHFSSPEKEKDTTKKDKIQVHITGTMVLFIKGNQYLVDNLQSSLILAIIVIGFLMAFLFASFRIILIVIICNTIPLLITAGLMGFFSVPLKPSTSLIFSITFGIAVDDAIHFLARYRRERKLNLLPVPEAVHITLKETGAGMFYTSIVLFFGFIVFTFSEFGSTQALGALTATTLITAMVSNLILLPALLLNFDSDNTLLQRNKSKLKKQNTH